MLDPKFIRENIELAIEVGVDFAGVLCGRATWKDGIPVYAKEGGKALEAWMLDRGVKNIQALNKVLEGGAKVALQPASALVDRRAPASAALPVIR